MARRGPALLLVMAAACAPVHASNAPAVELPSAPAGSSAGTAPVGEELVAELKPHLSRGGGSAGLLPPTLDRGRSTTLDRSLLSDGPSEDDRVLHAIGVKRALVGSFRARGAFTRAGSDQRLYTVQGEDYDERPPYGTRRVVVMEGERVAANVESLPWGGIVAFAPRHGDGGVDAVILGGVSGEEDGGTIAYDAALVDVHGGALHVHELGVVGRDACAVREGETGHASGTRIFVSGSNPPKTRVETFELPCK